MNHGLRSTVHGQRTRDALSLSWKESQTEVFATKQNCYILALESRLTKALLIAIMVRIILLFIFQQKGS